MIVNDLSARRQPWRCGLEPLEDRRLLAVVFSDDFPNAFIDAAKHWTGRGSGFQGPLGDEVLALVSSGWARRRLGAPGFSPRYFWLRFPHDDAYRLRAEARGSAGAGHGPMGGSKYHKKSGHFGGGSGNAWHGVGMSRRHAMKMLRALATAKGRPSHGVRS